LHVAPTAAPLIASLEADSPFSFTVSWQPPPLYYHNGRIASYHINITEHITVYVTDPPTIVMGKTWISIYDTPANYTQIIDDLRPHYNYSVKIAASTRIETENGNTRVAMGPFSAEIYVTTWEDGN